MTCSVKVVQLNEIYMCTEFHMNTCKYVWAIHQGFWLCSRGRRRAPVPHPGPSLCGVLMAADSNVCANFQEFLSTLRPPKVPGRLKKKIKKKKIIILWKTIGPCALLAWALIKAASSNERALAPGLTANGGFRKTANGEQYAFQVINTGGICQSHLYLPNFLLPAGGAMTITVYWHVDVFMPAHLSNIWSLVQIEHSMFELV